MWERVVGEIEREVREIESESESEREWYER